MTAESLLVPALRIAHMLAGAAWFGSLVYRTFFVDPRSKRFLGDPARYESFALYLADGMRYVVMLSLATVGISGFALTGLLWKTDPDWQALMAIKCGLWLIACGVFAYISWVHWPKRVFAVADEYRHLHRQGFWLALTMIGLSAAGLVLGTLARGLG